MPQKCQWNLYLEQTPEQMVVRDVYGDWSVFTYCMIKDGNLSISEESTTHFTTHVFMRGRHWAELQIALCSINQASERGHTVSQTTSSLFCESSSCFSRISYFRYYFLWQVKWRVIATPSSDAGSEIWQMAAMPQIGCCFTTYKDLLRNWIEKRWAGTSLWGRKRKARPENMSKVMQ